MLALHVTDPSLNSRVPFGTQNITRSPEQSQEYSLSISGCDSQSQTKQTKIYMHLQSQTVVYTYGNCPHLLNNLNFYYLVNSMETLESLRSKERISFYLFAQKEM